MFRLPMVHGNVPPLKLSFVNRIVKSPEASSVAILTKPLFEGRPNLRNLAEAINPVNRMHSSLHAAQLIQHLLGLRKQHDKSFVLIYLWFDVPNAPDAATHRQEVESFGRILKSDGIAFVSRTYQEVFQL